MSLPNGIARLNADGSQDMSFAGGSGLNAAGHCVLVLPTGRLLIGGAFTTYNGSSRMRCALLNANGTVHGTRLDANWDVFSLQQQVNGKVLVGGRFTSIGGVVRNRLARLTATLQIEPAFDPDANGTVRALAPTMDGKCYVGGAFSEMSGYSRSRLVRLFSDDTGSVIAVVSATLLEWQRAGSLPETQRVTWEVDTGSGYGPLAGTVTRISGGWLMVPTVALSGAGTVRATAHLHDSHSGGAQRVSKIYNFAPEITVMLSGVDTASGGTLAFADVQVGATQTLDVIIRNVGLEPLTISSSVISGTAAARYSRVPPAAVVPPGAETVCRVTFSPTTEGAQPAILTLGSNDSSESTFIINLLGSGIPGPGSIDASWQPTVTARPSSPLSIVTIACRDDDVIIGGGVTAVNAQTRRRWAEITQTAGVLPQSGSVPTKDVWFISPDLDGGVVLFSQDYTNAGVAVGQAHRFLKGNLETKFRLTWPVGLFSDICMIADGSILVASYPEGIYRITRGGKIDLTWPKNSTPQDPVVSLTPTDDGGYYCGFSRGQIQRYTAAGTLDTTFVCAAEALGNVTKLATCSDGGVMTMRSDAYGQKIVKLTGLGAVDPAFVESTWTSVGSGSLLGGNDLLMQADGNLIVMARTQGGINAVRRLLATGAEDPAWTPQPVTGGNNSLAQDASGKILVAFATRLHRILNTLGISALSVVSASRVTWQRSGSLPDVAWVRVELSEDAGVTWRLLGLAARMTGGWELTGLSLPRSGRVRVQAATASGVMTEIQTYANLPVAELRIEQSAVQLLEQSVVTFPGRLAGQSSEVTLTLLNTGSAILTDLTARATGEFSVVSLGLPGQANPTQLSPHQITQLTLRFSATLTGVKSGTVVITSSVPGVRGHVTLRLQGNAITLPTATTLAASLITRLTARISGNYQANDDSAVCTLRYRPQGVGASWIEVALDPAAGFTSQRRDDYIDGLFPNTNYEFQAIITNALGRVEAAQLRTFRTLL